MFFAGMSNASLDIPIIYDNMKENDETFYATINACGITLGSIDKTIVTILDDESKDTCTCVLIRLQIYSYVLYNIIYVYNHK